MKIMFTFLTYGIDIFGGVEKSIYSLIQGLLKIKVDVVVYTGTLCKDSNVRNYNIYYSDYLINNFSGLNDSSINDAIIDNYEKCNKEIKQELLDVIEIENPDYIMAVDHIWGIIPYIDIFEEVNCPIGLIFHMLHEENLVEKMFNYPFKHIFCVSNYVKNGLKKFNYMNRELMICPNCIGNEFYVDEKELDRINIFCNARIAAGKGVQCLIDAFVELSKIYPKCKLYLCNGDFHFMQKINVNKQIDRINNSFSENKVFLLPNLKWSEISVTLHQMDLVILPTEMETFGLGALETIASRIPLITTKVGNLPDLLQDSAFFIEINSSDSIVEAVKTVFTKSQQVNEKVEKGYQIAQEYLDVNVAKKLISYLQD